MQFSIITLFPQSLDSIFSESILKRAQKDKIIKIRTVDLRQYGLGKHKTVDDKPYGGGTGMVLKVDVLDQAIKASRIKNAKEIVVLLDPKGETYTQARAEKFTKHDHIIMVCGHYEGFDERVRDLVDYEISIGEYVLSGGEIAAAVIVESVARLIPGVLSKSDAVQIESFSQTSDGRLLEYPHYTRPVSYNGKNVPEILLSGNFAEIEKYRRQKAIELTRKKSK